MFGLFGKVKSAELSSALEKTFKEFESMPTQEFFGLAKKHSDGDIAAFMNASSGVEEPQVKELKFVFDSADADMKSFTAFFSQKSTLSFTSGAESQHPHPYTVSNDGCAYIGVASAVGVANVVTIGTTFCQAA